MAFKSQISPPLTRWSKGIESQKTCSETDKKLTQREQGEQGTIELQEERDNKMLWTQTEKKKNTKLKTPSLFKAKTQPQLQMQIIPRSKNTKQVQPNFISKQVQTVQRAYTTTRIPCDG